jgi:pimeloyl-ACP methyl ester carboxylesterase
MQKGHRMLIWFIILAALVLAAFWSGPAPLRSADGINRLEAVELGGVKQWVSIRAENPNAPVLLFLHGGPGSANIAKLRIQTPELEKHFVVVNWDQRGAGKSFSPFADATALTREQYVSDARELVGWLKQRFGVEKIYLMGFSWGTVLGLTLASQSPDDFAAFISVSQVVDYQTAERLSLEHALESAQKAGNERARQELASVDPAYSSSDWQSQLGTQRKWLLAFGGVYHTADSFSHEIKMLFFAPEYSFIEASLWPLGSNRSLGQTWPELMQVNFFEEMPALGCPVVFFAGRHDYNSPWQLSQAYYEALDAPAGKQLIWFENASHDIFFDEPDKLTREVLAVLQAYSSHEEPIARR